MIFFLCYNLCVKKVRIFFGCVCLLALGACDLQPKILSLPDTVGDFISARYPALLADPYSQPEIYNSAAIDYGVYASPNLYGSVESVDYVEYASVDDYILPPQKIESLYGIPKNFEMDVETGEPIVAIESQIKTDEEDLLIVPMYGGSKTIITTEEVIVADGDTLYSLAKKYGVSSEDIAKINSLKDPYVLTVGQKLNIPVKTEKPSIQNVSIQRSDLSSAESYKTTTRVELEEITVSAGDTLYSLSRKYSIPVNDLAVMNNLSAPFSLSVGQKLKVPNLSPEQKLSSTTPVSDNASGSQEGDTKVTNVKTKQKISSDPTKKLPQISARSSSKFSWPVRGKILSNYGAKSGGLFNDGINIGASKGTAVKAAENGVVAYAGNEVKGMGNLIIIQHSGGWMTVYAHMDSMEVRRGTKVSVGQKIGTVGATGKVDEPQLHFEIRKGTKAYNPSSYLKK